MEEVRTEDILIRDVETKNIMTKSKNLDASLE